MDVRFKIAANGASVDESGLKFDISDFDGYAVEAALQIKEKRPIPRATEVAVISLGPDVVQETLRKAMSMGADRAVQLKHDAPLHDSYAIATALAAELKGGALRPDDVRAHVDRYGESGDGHDRRRTARACRSSRPSRSCRSRAVG